MQTAPYTITLSPFEQMLEDCQKAINEGDKQTETALRAQIEAYLRARGA